MKNKLTKLNLKLTRWNSSSRGSWFEPRSPEQGYVPVVQEQGYVPAVQEQGYYFVLDKTSIGKILSQESGLWQPRGTPGIYWKDMESGIWIVASSWNTLYLLERY